MLDANEQISILEVLAEYGINIEKQASTLREGECIMILCPLPDHLDRDPSFAVYRDGPDAWHFHCFGCNRGSYASQLIKYMEPGIAWVEAENRAKKLGLRINRSRNDNDPVSPALFYKLSQCIRRRSPPDSEYRYRQLDYAYENKRKALAWRACEGMNDEGM